MGSDSEAEKSAQKEREKKKLLALAPIAKPLAGKKLCKRTLKLVRRAAEHKCLKRGVKEVVKSIRRGNKGICVIAGNISPIDVITHVSNLVRKPTYHISMFHRRKASGILKYVLSTLLIILPPLTIPHSHNWKRPINTDLANAGATKRPTCCVLVLTKPTKGELGQEEQEKLKAEHDQVASDISELANLMF
ncbi:UNVERIFIED_CONTAM: H/ACA ribonucleoprotein complex subunit-like protein [Sesamum calycinum]|uniref:H/ACA ribonucleoprotein complex subunit 2 n=1 Tax=Sesamum calycinum TaxID=2727403 RepID=A0AAW2RQR2_9LAMI